MCDLQLEPPLHSTPKRHHQRLWSCNGLFVGKQLASRMWHIFLSPGVQPLCLSHMRMSTRRMQATTQPTLTGTRIAATRRRSKTKSLDQAGADRAAEAAQEQALGQQLRAAWSGRNFVDELGLSDDESRPNTGETQKPSSASSGTRSYSTDSQDGVVAAAPVQSGQEPQAAEVLEAAGDAEQVRQQLVPCPDPQADSNKHQQGDQLVGGYTAAAQQCMAAICKASASGQPSAIATASLRCGAYQCCLVHARSLVHEAGQCAGCCTPASIRQACHE